MANWIIVTGITAVYLAVTLWIGLRARGGAEQHSSLEDYVTGGRSFGLMLMFFIMGAEVFSAAAFLGNPGWAYGRGAPAFYLIAYVGLMASMGWLLAPRIRRIAARMKYLTQADMLAGRFNSKTLAALIGLVAIVGLLPYLTIQVVGTGLMFSAATEGRVPFWLGALVATLIVMAYVYTSGMRGIGWTNFFQGLLMIVIAWVVGLAVPRRMYGGVGAMFERIAQEAPQYLTIPGGGAPFGWMAFSTAILVSALGAWMWPHLFMRFYAADSDRTLKRSLLMFPIFVFILVPLFFIGFAGILAFQDAPLARVDDVLLEIVVKTAAMPAWLIGIMLSGALAAAMSTGANIAHSAATVAVQDVIAKLHPSMSQDDMLRMIRTLVLVICAASYLIALVNPESLIATLLIAYAAIVQLLPLTLSTLFWPRATRAGAFSGLIAGSATALAYTFFWSPPLAINAGILGLIVNGVALVGVSLLTRPMDDALLRQFETDDGKEPAPHRAGVKTA